MPPEDDYGYWRPGLRRPLAYTTTILTRRFVLTAIRRIPAIRALSQEYMPRRVQTRPAYTEQDTRGSGKRRKSPLRIILTVLLLLLGCGAMGIGGVLIARHFVLSQGMQVRNDNETRVELTATTVDDHPAHVITIYGRENATVYLREMQTSYVIADGKVSITVPDYMWYDTESSTFATAVETDTMDISITPYIRYSQEGDQYQLDPIKYVIDVPLSPIRLVKPTTVRADVGVSIYEVQINVEKGSTVIIDGTNVSTLIRETGNVSKNVQVLPVGDNTISISVKSKYCRENKMEVTLYRAEQDIPLELDATVLVEWNYTDFRREIRRRHRRGKGRHAHSLHQRHNASRRNDHRRFPAPQPEVDPNTGPIQLHPAVLPAGQQRCGHSRFLRGKGRFSHHAYGILHAQRRHLHPPRMGFGRAIYRSGELHHHAQGHHLHGHGHNHPNCQHHAADGHHEHRQRQF
ncbi:MAG: hypothetical protein ACLTV6_04980 [Christensenellales bacterium]